MGAPQVTEAAPGQSGEHSQRPSLQTCPLGHIVPALGHATPGHDPMTGAPQATVEGDGQEETHSHAPAALQRWPGGHSSPRPHAASPGHALGMGAPQATESGLTEGQLGAQRQEPAVQTRPPVQRVPVPAQAAPVQPVRMGSPHATASAGGQVTVHSQRPPTQAWPASHIVPVAHGGCPGQTLGMGEPQATVEGSVPGQRGSHTQRRASGSQRSLVPQPPRHRPPQPSSAPHSAPAGHEGTHTHERVAGSQVSPAREHDPGQRPPQPSSAPQGESGEQSGAHTHMPKTQRSLRPRLQAGEHWQESRQRPLTQTDPSAQVTAAQGFSTQAPSTQYWVAAHTTPSQEVRGKHWRWQAWPSGQGAEQPRTASQSPVPGSQYCPSGHTTPVHGVGKQPATQRPSTQVSRAAQVTPAQGSRTATHWA